MPKIIEDMRRNRGRFRNKSPLKLTGALQKDSSIKYMDREKALRAYLESERKFDKVYRELAKR